MNTPSVPSTGRARLQLVAGVVMLLAWAGIQFGVAPHSGWFHVLLAAGVLFVIRGIAEA